uniref:Uncharacterized protein n=1 Tax=Oryza glumipatula TaxID=40148 RepID=A0A0E0AAS8_9ORYZ
MAHNPETTLFESTSMMVQHQGGTTLDEPLPENYHEGGTTLDELLLLENGMQTSQDEVPPGTCCI